MTTSSVRTSMPPVDEVLMLRPESEDGDKDREDIAGSPWMEAPERPISAPPVLYPGLLSDGSNLFAFQPAAKQLEGRDILQPWQEPSDRPDRPNSAPPFDTEQVLEEHSADEPVVITSRLGAIGSGSSRAPGGMLGPKGENLFAFSVENRSPSTRPPMPTSPPPLRENSADSGGPHALGISGESRCNSSADLYALQEAHWARAQLLGEDRRSTPPPTLQVGRNTHLTLSPTPGLSTPPPAGFGSPGPHTPGLATHMGAGGDNGPALLHPGTVRAYEPIDRSISCSAPPALDHGASLLAWQASYAASLHAASDIRCDEAYPEFFQMYQEQCPNLPPPLDPSPDLLRSRVPIDVPSPESVVDSGTQPELGIASFAAATGFGDPSVMAAYHSAHLPRSPSPPWESVGVGAHPGGILPGAAHLSHHAQQQLRQQYQQQLPSMPGLPPGFPVGPNQQVPPLSVPGAAHDFAAGRYPSLQGTPGYPHIPYSEASSYPWLGVNPNSPFGLSPGSASQLSPGKASVVGSGGQGPHGSALAGTRAPGLGQVGPTIGIPRGTEPQVDDASLSSHGHVFDASKRQQRDVALDADNGRSQRISGGNVSLATSAIAGVGGPAGSTASANAATAQRARERMGFKMSHLEDIFASNAFLSNVSAIARDQAGCRMLQHKLDEGNPEVTNAIFVEVLLHCVELMMDPFGNYLCQKLMDLGNHKQLELILDKVCPDLVRISLNMHGARAVQKLIDAVRITPHVPRLTRALEGSVVPLTQDPNGNHVIQRCLEVLPPESKAFVFRAIAEKIVEVATHRHGCRIVQRCVDAVQGSPFKPMLDYAICHNGLQLVQDPFGNYVVQYILGLHEPFATAQIIGSMYGRLHALSRQKFSSNVVERCLQLSGPEDKDRMIRELGDPRGLGELLRDVYGNYVVQSALTLANEQQLQILLGFIRPVLPSLRSTGQGRRIAQKLEKKYPQLRVGGDSASTNPRSGHIGFGDTQTASRHESALPVGHVASASEVGSLQGGGPLAQGIPNLLGSAVTPGLMQPGSVLGNGVLSGVAATVPGMPSQDSLSASFAGQAAAGKQRKGRKGKN